MLGLMQSRPLLISGLIDYASTWHGRREIVSRDPEGAIHRSNYAEVARRAKRVANALDALGANRGDRVATLAWNGWRHLEIYYGVTSSDAFCTRSIRASFPTRSNTSCTTRKTRMYSSTGFYAAHRGTRAATAACARLGRALRGKPASQDEA